MRTPRMQTQKIDLFNKLFNKNKNNSILNLRQYSILVGIFLIINFIFYAAQSIRLYTIKKNEATLLASIQLLEKEFLQKKQSYPQVFFEKDSKKIISAKNIELNLQKKLLLNISNHSLLTNYLNTLSKTISPNTWIKSITIADGGTNIYFSGNALDYPSLNAFVENINASTEFKHYRINLENISNEKNNFTKSGFINFKVLLKKWQI